MYVLLLSCPCPFVLMFVRSIVDRSVSPPCVPHLSSSDAHQLAQFLSLLYPMLNTLPSLPQSHLLKFISTITPLTTTNPTLFQPHLRPLLGFLPALYTPQRRPRSNAYSCEAVPYQWRELHFPASCSRIQVGERRRYGGGWDGAG
jgi:importin-5